MQISIEILPFRWRQEAPDSRAPQRTIQTKFNRLSPTPIEWRKIGDGTILDVSFIPRNLAMVELMQQVTEDAYRTHGWDVDCLEYVNVRSISKADNAAATHFMIMVIEKCSSSDRFDEACKKSLKKNGVHGRPKRGIFAQPSIHRSLEMIFFCDHETKRLMEDLEFTGVQFHVCPHCGGPCGYFRLSFDVFNTVPQRLISTPRSLYNLHHDWKKDFQIVPDFTGKFVCFVLSRRAMEFCAQLNKGGSCHDCVKSWKLPEVQFGYATEYAPCLPGDHADVIGIAPAEVVDKIGYPKYSTWPMRKQS